MSSNTVYGVTFLLAGILALAFSLYLARERRHGRQADREWTALLAPADAWDGTGWEWPPNVTQYLDDPRAYAEPAPTAPFQAVPISSVSGPLPVMSDAGTGIDAYLAAMQADTDAFTAAMRAHTDGWVAYYASGSEMAS
jgi:hypothetical protein